MTNGKTISGDWSIFGVLQELPDARAVLEGYGMMCGDCMASMDETLAQGAKAHGLDLEIILTELNSLLKTREEG